MSVYVDKYQTLLEMHIKLKEVLVVAYVLDRMDEDAIKGKSKLEKAQSSVVSKLKRKVDQSLKLIDMSMLKAQSADGKINEDEEGDARILLASHREYWLEFEQLIGSRGRASLAKKKAQEGFDSFEDFLRSSVHNLSHFEDVMNAISGEMSSELVMVVREHFAILSNALSEDTIRRDQMIRNSVQGSKLAAMNQPKTMANKAAGADDKGVSKSAKKKKR